jgi:hypothetical protein
MPKVNVVQRKLGMITDSSGLPCDTLIQVLA